MLEDEVEEKYYLSEQAIKGRLTTNYQKYKLEENIINGKEVHPTILARYEGAPTLYVNENNLPGAYGRNFGSKGKIQEKEYCDTLTASMGTGGGNVPILKIKNATKKGYLEAEAGDGIDISSRMEYHKGTVQKQSIQTLDCTGGEGHGVVTNDLRIRKLTPKECFRLQGVKDEDFEKCAKNQSDSSLYHLAGDSIVTNCLCAIFKNLIESEVN